MRELRGEPGVTAMIWDELCANEKQRLERRGVRARARERILINEDVCEGCGDCGVKSACVSLRPVATPLGRKTRLHEGSCSDDRACLDGDCPAFISVEAARREPTPFEARLAAPLPEPPALDWDGERLELLLVGIGSTGVVTIDALLVRAAEHDGLYAMHLDQTGLAQRGGKVVSHCVLSSRADLAAAPRVEPGRADVLLAFDPLGAGGPRGAARARPGAHARGGARALRADRRGRDAPGFAAARSRRACSSRCAARRARSRAAGGAPGRRRAGAVALRESGAARLRLAARARAAVGAVRSSARSPRTASR